MIQDHSNHGASKEPNNPLWEGFVGSFSTRKLGLKINRSSMLIVATSDCSLSALHQKCLLVSFKIFS